MGDDLHARKEQRKMQRDHVFQWHVALALDSLEVGALAPPHEERLVEADGLHRPHGRVDASWDQAPSQTSELGLGL